MFFNFKNINLIGALTSKEHVFSARPWEIDRVESIDYFDSCGSKIYVEFSDFKILRILPQIATNINSEWISNKVRFYYDSLKVQRLITPIMKKNKGGFQLLDWFDVYLYFRSLKIFFFKDINNLFDSFFYSNIYYFMNEDIDLLNLISIKNLGSNFSYFTINNFVFSERADFVNIDFFNDYVIYPGAVTYFDKFNMIYLFGYNIRCEHPLLFIQIYLKKKVKLVTFGIPYLNLFKIQNIGVTIKDFFHFIFLKKNKMKKINLLLKTHLFLIGSSLFNRLDGFIYKHFFEKFFMILRIKYNIFCSIKYIYSNIAVLNTIFLGLIYNFSDRLLLSDFSLSLKKVLTFSNFYNSSLFFSSLFNFFVFENEVNFNFNNMLKSVLSIYIYNGVQVAEYNENYDLFLPITHFYERESVLYNIFSEKAVIKFVYAPLKNMKDSFELYKYIFNIYSMMFTLNDDFNKNVIFKYLQFVTFKYLSVLEIFKYNLITDMGCYVYYNILLTLSLNNLNYEVFYLNKVNLSLSFIVYNNFFLYAQHNLYLSSNILKLSKFLVLATVEYNINNRTYMSFI